MDVVGELERGCAPVQQVPLLFARASIHPREIGEGELEPRLVKAVLQPPVHPAQTTQQRPSLLMLPCGQEALCQRQRRLEKEAPVSKSSRQGTCTQERQPRCGNLVASSKEVPQRNLMGQITDHILLPNHPCYLVQEFSGGIETAQSSIVSGHTHQIGHLLYF